MILRLSNIISQNDNVYIFEDQFDSFLLSDNFKNFYGTYLPFCYKFRFIDNTIYYPPLEKNYFSSVATITLEDMLHQNYTPLDVHVRNNKIFVLDGHHRILRFLILCLENEVSLGDVFLKIKYIERL